MEVNPRRPPTDAVTTLVRGLMAVLPVPKADPCLWSFLPVCPLLLHSEDPDIQMVHPTVLLPAFVERTASVTALARTYPPRGVYNP